jgi:hypothetical protein
MKLVYDQLPTRYVKNKKSGQSWVPETCQFCGVETETFEHLLKCNHNAGAEFRKTLPRSGPCGTFATCTSGLTLPLSMSPLARVEGLDRVLFAR